MKLSSLIVCGLFVLLLWPWVPAQGAELSVAKPRMPRLEYQRLDTRITQQSARFDRLKVDWTKQKTKKFILKPNATLLQRKEYEEAVALQRLIDCYFSYSKVRLEKIRAFLDDANSRGAKREEYETAFENFDEKANQLFNTLSTVLKNHREIQSAVTRNLL